MGARRILAAAVCVLVNVLDGFDILMMSVAAPLIGASLALSASQIGLMFSSGLIGMMIGALVLAALADYVGRRTMILVCLIINTVGMFGTGLSANFLELMLFRFVTGMGVGGMMPTVNTAIAELANARRRQSIVIIQAAAYPAGGLLAAAMWALTSHRYGWHELIQAACLPSAFCLGLVALFVPESIPFLLARRPIHALERINAALRRFGRTHITILPKESGLPLAAGVGSVLEKTGGRSLIVLSVATFLAQFSFYFFISWIPVVLAGSSMTGPVQRAGPMLLNIGGIIGDLVFAGLAVSVSVRRLTPAAMILAFSSVAALAFSLAKSALTLAVAGIVGASLFAAMAGIYSIAPGIFTSMKRARNTGIVLSIGRLGGAISPWLGALLIQSPGLRLEVILLCMATPLLVAGAALGLLPHDVPTVKTPGLHSQ
jgi:MFS family permease